MRTLVGISLAIGLAVLPQTANAESVDLLVVVENLAPTNSVTFAPLRVGFNSGVYDSFDSGAAASAAIVSIAEGGSG
ncbi:MAG: hypothetical protein KDA33_10435, partial [Phycisphaerales bacterium]|nr:hypothetical protein [Phycisphaerales bacterium]